MSHAAWMRQAESDLAAAKILSRENCHSQAVWLAGQAVEKSHKAILVALGLRYEEKHYKYLGHTTSEISKLLPAALHEPVDPQVATMLVTLENRAIASRYPAPPQNGGQGAAPLVAPAESVTSSQREVDDAERLIAWCRDRIERALRAVQTMGSQP